MVGLQVTHTSVWLGHRSGLPKTSLRVRQFAILAHRTQGSTLVTLVHYVIQGMIKGTDEEQGEELHGARFSRVPGAALSPWSWAAPPSQHVDVSTSPEAPQNP